MKQEIKTLSKYREPENIPTFKMTKAEEKLAKKAREDYESGKTVSHAELKKKLGL
ncbi:MAG: hypothetical protein AABX70_06280 [Nanoarchaeota archaeon]